jgi:hypothetical protein
MMVVKLQPEMFMLNPASGGASVGVWGRNPSAGNLLNNFKINRKLRQVCGKAYYLANLLNNLNEQGSKRADNS